MTPTVLSEWATMQRVAETGCNLSRFGRCELKLALGRPGLAQSPDVRLRITLRAILLMPHRPHILVCLPRVFEGFPDAHKQRVYGEFTRPELTDALFQPGKVYGSTFVTRRDGWIGDMDEDAYWRLVRGIWQDRPVLLVVGSSKGRRAADEFLTNASSVDTLDAPQRDAWAAYEGILNDCLAWAATKQRPLVYAALGASAAVLADCLGVAGIQCLDMGHAAQSWARRGERLAA